MKNGNNFIYIFIKWENMSRVRKMHESMLAGKRYTVPYMGKLRNYIFKDAYVYTPDYFEKYFVNKFEF